MGTVELAVVGLAGSGIGTLLGVPMVWPLSKRPSDVRFMGAALLGLSVIAAIISSRIIGLLPAAPAVNHLINLAGLASYPALYLYIRAQTGRPLRAAAGWWLWIPCAVYAAVLIVRAAAGGRTSVPFVWMLPVLLAFTALCAAAVIRRRERPPSAIVPPETIVAFLAILNAAQIVRMLFGRAPLVPSLIPLVVTGGFAALVALVTWRSIERRGFDEAPASEPRYAKSGLDPESAAALLTRIDTTLSTDRLFADPGLTLTRLAAAAGCSPHQVSEVLNRFGGLSFHDLLNRRRVADVKAQLLDPASARYSIEGIGASAGFGSRSALYAAFRRIEGMTPAQFRDLPR